MNPNQQTAFKYLEQAQQALKSGDKNTARQLAEQAAQLAPELEEVWLMMAALSSPGESVSYLEKALQINPNSERAKKGLIWAQGRVQKEKEASPVPAQAPVVEPQPAIPAEPEQPASSLEAQAESAVPAEPIPAEEVLAPFQEKKSTARPRMTYITLLAILVCVVLVWITWQGVTPVGAFFNSAFMSREHGPAFAQVNIAKAQAAQLAPAATATPTAAELAPTSEPDLVSPTPTTGAVLTEAATSTETPAATDTVLAPTDTEIPATETAVSPTETAIMPQDTVIPLTETPFPTADLAVATIVMSSGSQDQATPTALPTDTAAPRPTRFTPATMAPNATPNPNTSGTSNNAGRWIDVDLTHQTVYAYEGSTVVNTFIVSTGTWQYPTVTGQYHIYVKYRYKNMSGPGYFLPNVPYTMFFYQGYALHGTYWHSNFGHPMSHGCVNLSIPDSEWMYNWASVGTLVNVHN